MGKGAGSCCMPMLPGSIPSFPKPPPASPPLHLGTPPFHSLPIPCLPSCTSLLEVGGLGWPMLPGQIHATFVAMAPKWLEPAHCAHHHKGIYDSRTLFCCCSAGLWVKHFSHHFCQRLEITKSSSYSASPIPAMWTEVHIQYTRPTRGPHTTKIGLRATLRMTLAFFNAALEDANHILLLPSWATIITMGSEKWVLLFWCSQCILKHRSTSSIVPEAEILCTFTCEYIPLNSVKLTGHA